MPQIVQSTIKTRNLSISGIFVDLLQLVAMNDWLFHRLSVHLSTKSENKPSSGSIQNDHVTTNPICDH
ncbi:hypothetical protein DERF_001704 [Dermatophagoides farinae]|uniref:Uncharacterized protein n=1 Tax=Dermatophagoides farinae TaxID=6954 RepID=A0A922L8W7_DERFA|nr:hypothetical protein DERF_001704 [Dermatophagoides farinae]